MWHRGQAPPRGPEPIETDDAEPFELQRIGVALLEFCIELIRQRSVTTNMDVGWYVARPCWDTMSADGPHGPVSQARWAGF